MSSDAPTWQAVGPGWFLEWKRTEPHLEGSEAILEGILEALAARKIIPLAPGLTVKADPAEPLAVLAVLRDVAGTAPYGVSDKAPKLPGIPKGAVS